MEVRNYELTYYARLSTAIGIFYPVTVVVKAESVEQAEELGWEKIHENGYDVNHLMSCKLISQD